MGELGPFEPLPVGEELLRHWVGLLSKAEKASLNVLADAFPRSLPKEEVADLAGY